MTVIHGQIGTLKKIRETLDQKGITRFNSVADINLFLKNFDNEIEELLFTIERDFDSELNTLQAEGSHLQKNYDLQKTNAETNLNGLLSSLKVKCDSLRKPAKNAVLELLNWYQLQVFLASKFLLENCFHGIIGVQTYNAKKLLKTSLKKINTHDSNRQIMINSRYDAKYKTLYHMHSVVTELYPVIAGAIGENLVVKELEKLTCTYMLINDFSMVFEKPIYYKQKNSHILSVQIDHLLITTAGIFIIETKNWSKTSLARLDLWSPIEQMQRSNFALYKLLNSTTTTVTFLLKEHHWGSKNIPIRNILAMIHNRPKERFNNVTIKTLHELDGYISYFEPIFDASEVHRIGNHLLRIKG